MVSSFSRRLSLFKWPEAIGLQNSSEQLDALFNLVEPRMFTVLIGRFKLRDALLNH